MTDPNTRPAQEPLQFDRAVESDAPAAGAPSTPALTCSSCGQPITTSYYQLGGATLCANCKLIVERTLAEQHTRGAFLRSAILGLAAAVAGAAIYYGVIALLGLEIGIVAILIGYMVGAAVRKGARGGGGRRYQILAVALTYFSVGLAYSPLAFKGFAEGRAKASASADSARTFVAPSESASESVAAVAPASRPITTKRIGAGALLLALGATFLFIFVLPILAVMGSGASGIISVIIIGVGMRQAWRMTAGHTVVISGPYRVGGSPETTPAPTA